MAMSVDGFIARNNGDEDFLSDKNWGVFCELANKIGCFVVGRKTYEVVKKWKGYSFDDIKANKIIVSKNRNIKVKKGSYYIADSPKEALKTALKLGYNQVLLTGGSKTNSSFLKMGLINELILNIEPFILGKGIKLFKEEEFNTRLSNINIKNLSSGIIQIHYKILKSKR